MANNFREIRHKPPLFEHRGDKSTLAKVDLGSPEGPLNWTMRINLKYDAIKVRKGILASNSDTAFAHELRLNLSSEDTMRFCVLRP